ncbi:MAG: SurA N-terminal domain-containing protein, partial [Acidobacteriota bacterium]
MLKVFRDNLKNLAWILWLVIIVFILLVFVDFGTVNRPGTPQSAAASVGDYEVTWAEFQRRYQQTENQYRERFGDQYNQELARQLQLPRQVIEGLLNNRVLLAEADRMGLTVSDQEVRESILEIPGVVDEQGRFIDQEIYAGFTRRLGYNGPGEFENAMRESLLIQKLFDVVAQNVHLTDAEVEDAYREEVESAAVRFVQVPRNRFAGEVEASREQLQSHYEQHQEEYRLPEQRVVDYLIVDKALLRAQLEISEEEMRAFYEDNADDFTRETQVRASHILLRTGERSAQEATTEIEAIRDRIEGGEDFAAVAREVSEDPGTKEQGGDLGFFGRGRMTPEFEDAAFDAEPGELVGPVTTPFGVHLIRVEERREGGRIPFEEARSTVRGRIAAE